MTNRSVRTIITPKVVAEAVRFAALAQDSNDVRDYLDSKQHYLQLRQRGRSANWFVRAKGARKKSAPRFGMAEILNT